MTIVRLGGGGQATKRSTLGLGRSIAAGRKTSGGMPRKNAREKRVGAHARPLARHAATDAAADRDIASGLNG